MKGLLFLGKKSRCVISHPDIGGEVSFRKGKVTRVEDAVAKWFARTSPVDFHIVDVEGPAEAVDPVEEEVKAPVAEKKYLRQMNVPELVEKAMEYDLDFTVDTPTKHEMIEAIKEKQRETSLLPTV